MDKISFYKMIIRRKKIRLQKKKDNYKKNKYGKLRKKNFKK